MVDGRPLDSGMSGRNDLFGETYMSTKTTVTKDGNQK